MPIDSYFNISKRNYIFFSLHQFSIAYGFVTYHRKLYIVDLHCFCILLYSSAVRSTQDSFFSYLPIWIPNSCVISLIAFFLLNNFIKNQHNMAMKVYTSIHPIWTGKIYHPYLNSNLTSLPEYQSNIPTCIKPSYQPVYTNIAALFILITAVY